MHDHLESEKKKKNTRKGVELCFIFQKKKLCLWKQFRVWKSLSVADKIENRHIHREREGGRGRERDNYIGSSHKLGLVHSHCTFKRFSLLSLGLQIFQTHKQETSFAQSAEKETYNTQTHKPRGFYNLT